MLSRRGCHEGFPKVTNRRFAMPAVKTLALGLMLTGSLAAPALAGSIKHHHAPSHQADSGLHQPTTLTYAAPASGPAVGQENLAIAGSNYGPTGYTTTSGYAVSSASLGTTPSATLGTTGPAAAKSSAPAPAASGPAPAGPSLGGLQLGQASAGHSVDAYLNFGNGPYSEAQSLTSGAPQAWYQSQAVQNVYHGTPTADQQAGFIADVVRTVQHAYAASGLNVSLTTDPTRNFAHTMSVVSGASYGANPNAIGITDVGNDGFSFIDKFGQASSPNELATAIGNNLAHELMHAFGIANHPDQTGNYLDAASVNWSLLANPDGTLSPQAAQLLASQNFLNGPGKEFTQGSLGLTGLEVLTQHHPVTCHCPYCGALRALRSPAAEALGAASPVPEPTTFALWALAGGLALLHRRRKLA